MKGKLSLTARKLKRKTQNFLLDESGQSTTEYVLLLLFVVIAVKYVGGTLKDRLKNLIDQAFNKATDVLNEG